MLLGIATGDAKDTIDSETIMRERIIRDNDLVEPSKIGLVSVRLIGASICECKFDSDRLVQFAHLVGHPGRVTSISSALLKRLK